MDKLAGKLIVIIIASLFGCFNATDIPKQAVKELYCKLSGRNFGYAVSGKTIHSIRLGKFKLCAPCTVIMTVQIKVF